MVMPGQNAFAIGFTIMCVCVYIYLCVCVCVCVCVYVSPVEHCIAIPSFINNKLLILSFILYSIFYSIE